MQEVYGDLWRTMGTSLVWDPGALAEATAGGVTISLRELLGWEKSLPPEPPEGAATVVVTGLQEMLDVLPEAESNGIMDRVHAVVRKHSGAWGETAIVFAMQETHRFTVRPPSGSVVLRLQNGRQVEIGDLLWHGAAADAQQIMVTRTDAKSKELRVQIGCWLRRVS